MRIVPDSQPDPAIATFQPSQPSDRTGQDTGLDSSLLLVPAAIDSRYHMSVMHGGDVEDDDDDDDDDGDDKKGYRDSDEVVFKCIGANKQEDRQLVLEELLKLRPSRRGQIVGRCPSSPKP